MESIAVFSRCSGFDVLLEMRAVMSRTGTALCVGGDEGQGARRGGVGGGVLVVGPNPNKAPGKGPSSGAKGRYTDGRLENNRKHMCWGRYSQRPRRPQCSYTEERGPPLFPLTLPYPLRRPKISAVGRTHGYQG
uniref:Uncharacterized protein n=1 Tax=Knipowitschia caucasica TaxID=637954 RepID=A0AAV2JRT5_KNICA